MGLVMGEAWQLMTTISEHAQGQLMNFQSALFCVRAAMTALTP